jgi:dipeptidyl aminopeptidase/acylaminoacyl peptidase
MVWAAVVALGSRTAMLVWPVAGSGARSDRPDVGTHAHRLTALVTYVAGNTIDSVRADGTGRRSLAGAASPLHGGPTNGRPAFSRDGSRIVFVRSRESQSGKGGRIWLMRADGSHRRRLATDAFPQFSPDGGRIVFVRELPAATSSDPLASTELWVMNADGSGQRRLTHCTQDLEPSWSPDGP